MDSPYDMAVDMQLTLDVDAALLAYRLKQASLDIAAGYTAPDQPTIHTVYRARSTVRGRPCPLPSCGRCSACPQPHPGDYPGDGSR